MRHYNNIICYIIANIIYYIVLLSVSDLDHFFLEVRYLSFVLLNICYQIVFMKSFCFADMRKAMSMDKEKKSMIPLPHPVHSNDIWLESEQCLSSQLIDSIYDHVLTFLCANLSDIDDISLFGYQFVLLLGFVAVMFCACILSLLIRYYFWTNECY